MWGSRWVLGYQVGGVQGVGSRWVLGYQVGGV